MRRRTPDRAARGDHHEEEDEEEGEEVGEEDGKEDDPDALPDHDEYAHLEDYEVDIAAGGDRHVSDADYDPRQQ